MVGQHHWLNRQEFEQTPGDNEGQGNLTCYSPRGHRESDATQRLNNHTTDWGANRQQKFISRYSGSQKRKKFEIMVSAWLGEGSLSQTCVLRYLCPCDLIISQRPCSLIPHRTLEFHHVNLGGQNNPNHSTQLLLELLLWIENIRFQVQDSYGMIEGTI